MYGDKGRSGHHVSNVGNHWQDWDGVSPNGRQFKNAFTQEVRDLSGSEYWKARKANNPTECDLKNHFNNNGSANIRAYADMETPKKKTVKKKSAFEQITLADRHYQRMENLALQLDTEYEEGSLSDEDYLYAMRQIEIRKEKAWIRLCKLRGWDPEQIDVEFEQEIFEENNKKPIDNAFVQGISFTHSVIESLSDGNIFKKAFKKVLTAKQKLDKIVSVTKQILQE